MTLPQAPVRTAPDVQSYFAGAMLKIKHILVPTDFSDHCGAAARYSEALAIHFHAGVLLAHVAPEPPTEYRAFSETPWGSGPRSAEAWRESLDSRLKTEAGKLGLAASVETVLLSGDPAESIARLADEREVGLIVMPTHGRGLFRRMLLGSTTAKTLHDADQPVLTGVHLGDETPFIKGGYKKIACAVGLREPAHSEKVLRWAAEFASSWEAELLVVHTPPSLALADPEWLPPDTAELVRRAAREHVDKLLLETGAKATVHVGGGDPTRYVCELVKEENCDLLVVGRSFRRGLGGGDAYEFVRESACPVVSV